MTQHSSMHTSRGGATDATGRKDILAQIREGMDVYDNEHNHIGRVDFVHFGAASEAQSDMGVGPATSAPADDPDMGGRSFVDFIAEAFHPDEVPQELEEKLRHSGYIRLDASGLFAADRFITPDQIVGVSDDEVLLNSSRDQLIKRR
jgi:hypothetical protein